MSGLKEEDDSLKSLSKLQETEEYELEHDLLEILNEEDDDTTDKLNRCGHERTQSPPLSHARHPTLRSLTLTDLTDAMTLRALCYLSAVDLCSIAQTSKHFSCLCQANVVWRRLYALRWNPQTVEEDHLADVDMLKWYELYKEKDMLEVSEVLKDVPDEMRVIYKQMIAAKRSEIPTQPLLDDTSLFSSHSSGQQIPGTMQHTIQVFRKAHGLPLGSSVQKPCKAGECNWLELRAFIWACTLCGELHLCEDQLCAERQLDRSSNLLVCPISGRCFNRMLREREEEEEGGGGGGNNEDGNGGGGPDWNAEEGMGGRLGRAFYAGYNADAKELQYRFGIKF